VAGLVERFLTAFIAGRLNEARALTGPGFQWFGRPLFADDWDAASAFLAEKQMRQLAIRSFPGEVLAALPAATIALLPERVGAEDRLFFADIERGGALVTIGIIVRAERLRHVFDPTDFAGRILADNAGR
jgi:hypothetical protein